MGRRRSVFPYLMLAVVFTYGLWWYGSTQPEGTTMHDLSDRIGAVSGKARSTIAGWIGSDSTDTETEATAAPAEPTPKRTRRRTSDTPAPSPDVKKPDSVVTKSDSAPVKRDSAVTPPG